MFVLSNTLSAFRLRKVSKATSKQHSTRRCSNIIVLLCTVETGRVQSLTRTIAWTNFKSI